MGLTYEGLELGQKLHEMDARIKQLEKHIHYPHNANVQAQRDACGLGMKEAAARAQDVNIAQGCIPDSRVQAHSIGDSKGLLMRTDVETIRTAMKEAAAQDKAIGAHPYGDPYAALKSQAAQVQGSPDRVPMRTDVETIRTLTAFAKRLLNTEDFGHAVTFEVRQAARRALGLPEVKEYDL